VIFIIGDMSAYLFFFFFSAVFSDAFLSVFPDRFSDRLPVRFDRTFLIDRLSFFFGFFSWEPFI